MPTFVNPLALWGLALASAPIIIHLLNRRRFKVVEWAAMEFLLASSRKNYRRIRIEQLLLLALRVLLIVVLVLLVARPVVRRQALGAVAEQRRFVLLVVDTSMSMGYRDGSMASYDRALAFAEELMASLREGDTWALVAAVGRGRVAVQEPSFDLEAARAAVARDRLPLSDSDGSIPRALEAAEEILARVQVPVKDIYVVTDLQRASWLGPTGAVSAEDAERAKRLAKAARVLLVDVGAAEPSNLAVASLVTDASLVVAGGESLLRAEVANYGAATAGGVSVNFLVDGFRQQRSEPRSIAPGGTAQWDFRHVFRTPGAHTVTAELDPDNLAKDDSRFLALDVRDNIPVLCVDGEPGTDAFTGETDYLRRSLRPGDGAEKGVSLFQPEVVSPDALSAAELPRYDAVVLANVEKLGEPTVATLESYVRDGGALVVFLGDKVDRDFYNRVLYRGGQGVLPCSLGDAVGDADDRKQAAHISDELTDHPFVRLFREQKVIKLSSPLFFRYYRLENAEDQKGVRVVARFGNGAPAIIEGERGRGRVVVFASSADDEWNDMPSWPAYLTLLQEVMAQVARDPGATRNVTVGEPIVRHVSPEQFGKPVQLLRPGDSKPVVLAATASGGLLAVTYDVTDRAGVYELSLQGDVQGKAADRLDRRQDFFAVNVPARESDVRRISEAELRRAFPGFDFEYQRGGVRRAPAAAPGEGGELWRSLAYALLGLVLLESILAQRFGR